MADTSESEALNASHRATWLTTFDLHRLDLAVEPLRRFCPDIYLVGTVLTSPDWRDVDVRMILADDEFDAAFGNSLLWEAFCLTATSWLRSETGLPTSTSRCSAAPRRTRSTRGFGITCRAVAASTPRLVTERRTRRRSVPNFGTGTPLRSPKVRP